jgi:hypothetical protein
VEELNPDFKKTNPKYTFPFTTVLVDWKQGATLAPLPPLGSAAQTTRYSAVQLRKKV